MLLLVGLYVLVPQLGGMERSLAVIADLSPWLVGVAAAVQAAAFAAQAALTHAVLPVGGRPGFADVARVELASTSLSHMVPGGTAAGTALGYQLLRRMDVPGSDAGLAVAARGLGSALVLNALLWLALAVSIPNSGFRPVYTAVAIAALVLIATFGALVVLFVRRSDRATRVVATASRAFPGLAEDRVATALERIGERVRRLAAQPKVQARAAGWSAAYWLLSAASLWLFLAAVGHRAGVASLVVAFGVANVLAVIPVTPRGLGIVEGTLIPLLVAFGAPSAAATVGVLSWRLVSFWVPIPLGGLAYVSLRLGPVGSGGSGAG